MRVARQVLVAAAAAVLAASGATARVHFPGPQPRDQRPGTAVIRGLVIDAATGSPVRRARIRLSGRQPGPFVLTDTDGRFAFTAVSAGEWTLAVEKALYTPTQYPQAGRTLRPAGGRCSSHGSPQAAVFRRWL